MTYIQGHVKRDPATGGVAVRTMFPDEGIASQAWLLATLNRGALFVRTSDVEAWEDLFIPVAPIDPYGPPPEPTPEPAP